jgi:7-carboxy-7-deazaguanine synthase
MPRRPTLRVVEVFASVQGEGLRQGEPTIFIRLAGCNLRCPFCDTAHAWTGGRPMTEAGVQARVEKLRRRFPAEWICLTGGEPLLQDIVPLVRSLRKKRLKIQVETNGTVFRPAAADWLTLSPKPTNYRYDARFRRLAREVKLIVTKNISLAVIRKMRDEFPAKVPILLQPESNARWSRARAVQLLRRAISAGLVNIRVSIQLHKVLGIP